MTKETMNIHKALCELKLLDARIAKEVNALTAVGVTKKVAQMVGSRKVTDFTAAATDQYKKISDLIARRAAIKKAVVLSNAKTTVTIAGTEYTVAEAIEMKNHGLDGKKMLLTRLVAQLTGTETSVQMANDRAERDADAYVQSIFGGKDSKNNAVEVAAARKAYLESQAVEMVDVLDVRKLIQKLDDEINAFTSEVDSILSTSNANTNIEIEY